MKRILVCEDEASIRDFVVINLKRSGYEVVEAGSGEEALQKFEDYKGDVDIALLDIMLPGMDGFAVCKELRQKSSSMGIIILTARTQEMEKVGGLMMGADDYVTKPFSPSELMARVDALYRRVMALRSREESGGDRIGGFCPQSAQPHPAQAGAAHRADPGGIPDYGVLFHQSRQSPEPYQYPHPGMGGGVFRRGKNRGRQHPAAAYEDRGGSLQSPIYPDGMGHGL